MKVFAIGDLHLSGNPPTKPMDIFGPHWNDHWSRIKEHWNANVSDEDIVFLVGDMSWALRLDEAACDLQEIASLPGKKYMIRGNHDYWWTTARKMERYLTENGFDTMHILHNNACMVGDYALCGTRGWPFDDTNAQDAKIMAREAGRLRMSLQAGGSAQKIAFLHYPPVYPGGCAQPLVDILHEFGVQQCYYGHLHGKSIRGAIQREVDGIRYKLVSADGLHFCPYKICD